MRQSRQEWEISHHVATLHLSPAISYLSTTFFDKTPKEDITFAIRHQLVSPKMFPGRSTSHWILGVVLKKWARRYEDLILY